MATSAQAIVSGIEGLAEPLPHSPAEYDEVMAEFERVATALYKAAETLRDGLINGLGPLDGFMVDPSTVPVLALGSIQNGASDIAEGAQRARGSFTEDPDTHGPLREMMREHGIEGWLAR